MASAKALPPKPQAQGERSEDKLDRELAAFERLKPSLLQTHRGLYVAIHHGTVIGADTDDFRLAALVEERARREGPIAICQVAETGETNGEWLEGIFWEPPMEERG